ncbi:MAG: pyrroline-5-carboxylate reductase [Clostridia bacterium]|nr:pyrroline-5-carboxylate reductase [Clostridia bacterium]
MKKIGVIGYGNIGEAMISGMLKSKFTVPEKILVSSRNEKKIKYAIDVLKINVTRDNLSVVEFSDILIIAVKPIAMKEVLEEIKEYIKEDQIIVSVVSSVETKDIEAVIGKHKIVRSMLNTPVMVNEGMSALSIGEAVSYDEESLIVEMFQSFGQAEIVDEKYMDVITAVAGTSPAYVFMMIEAMADGGVLMGLPRRKAYKMSAQAVLGAAKMVLESEQHPGDLKDMVCSPGGSTIDGVYTLETNNFRGTIMKTIKDATRKVIRIREKL